MSDFTHLHVHSHYSLLDGLGKVEPMLRRAKDMGMDALAITDHGAMYGAVEMVRSAKEIGIKPIIGLEAYLAPKGRLNKRGRVDANPRHLTLLAQNNEGYKNLIKLTTASHLEGYYYKPRIDYELLAEHSAGIIVLSGCLNSDLSKAITEKRLDDAEDLLKWHLDVFGRERFYLEVQDHPTLREQKIVNEALVKFGQQHNLGLAATADSHYLHPEDAEAHDVLICVQTGKVVQDKDRMSMLGEDFSLKSTAEMKERWKEHAAAIDNTQKIAEMCEVTMEFGVNQLPHYPLPRKVTADEQLRKDCEARLVEIYDDQQIEEARERMEYELGVITKTGYASYFLIVADFVNEAKRRGILVGPGRGSAAGSLVSFLTGITGLDPLHYNLLFERFLNPERVSMPDIDLDFADDRRDEIIDYVREKYGDQHVAQIITFGTMAARAAIRDAGRALGLPYAFCDQVAKSVPPFMNFEQALAEGADLKALYESDPQAKRLIDTAKKLEGVSRHASTHAAGVVITEKPLTEYLPLQLSSTSKGERDSIVTQYAMNEVEALGLLKMDFLGLKNLTIIQNAMSRIKTRHGTDIDLDNLPLDDEATYKLLQEGKTTGVFQLESAGMKRYLKELKPTEFEDIISIGALYRPGPMDSIPDFIAAKHGKKRITYLHPLLKPILEKTYGVIVTQDQVLEIAREFAGFSYAEADILRKAVGKKIRKLLDEQREKFVAGAVNSKQIALPTAQKVWDFIEPFARYGFNRAHAACYAMIAYQTAYLKANWPADFMASLLTADEGNVDRQAVEVAEALSLDIEVLGPDLNDSEHDFTVVKGETGQDAIRFGLAAIKHVGDGAVTAIVEERKSGGRYEDLFDLFRRVNSRDINRKSVESLAKAGAFDQMAERNFVLQNADKLLDFNRNLHKKIDVGQQGLFGAAADLPAPRVTLAEVPAGDPDERLAWEKELMGFYLSEHPLTSLAKELEQVVTPLSDLPSLNKTGAGQAIRVAGVVTRLTKIVTKSGQPMVFAQFEDLAGKAEVLVFPKLLAATSAMWEDGAKLLVEGKLSDKDDEPKVLADKVWQLNKATLQELANTGSGFKTPQRALGLETARYLVINLPSSLRKPQLEKLKELLAQSGAGADGLQVELIVPSGGERRRVATEYSLPKRAETVAELKNIVGAEALQYRN